MQDMTTIKDLVNGIDHPKDAVIKIKASTGGFFNGVQQSENVEIEIIPQITNGGNHNEK